MKTVASAGGRVATEFAPAGRWRTCRQETGCQIDQRGEMCHPPYNFTCLGSRRPKGCEKLL